MTKPGFSEKPAEQEFSPEQIGAAALRIAEELIQCEESAAESRQAFIMGEIEKIPIAGAQKVIIAELVRAHFVSSAIFINDMRVNAQKRKAVTKPLKAFQETHHYSDQTMNVLMQCIKAKAAEKKPITLPFAATDVPVEELQAKLPRPEPQLEEKSDHSEPSESKEILRFSEYRIKDGEIFHIIERIRHVDDDSSEHVESIKGPLLALPADLKILLKTDTDIQKKVFDIGEAYSNLDRLQLVPHNIEGTENYSFHWKRDEEFYPLQTEDESAANEIIALSETPGERQENILERDKKLFELLVKETDRIVTREIQKWWEEEKAKRKSEESISLPRLKEYFFDRDGEMHQVFESKVSGGKDKTELVLFLSGSDDLRKLKAELQRNQLTQKKVKDMCTDARHAIEAHPPVLVMTKDANGVVSSALWRLTAADGGVMETKVDGSAFHKMKKIYGTPQWAKYLEKETFDKVDEAIGAMLEDWWIHTKPSKSETAAKSSVTTAPPPVEKKKERPFPSYVYSEGAFQRFFGTRKEPTEAITLPDGLLVLIKEKPQLAIKIAAEFFRLREEIFNNPALVGKESPSEADIEQYMSAHIAAGWEKKVADDAATDAAREAAREAAKEKNVYSYLIRNLDEKDPTKGFSIFRLTRQAGSKAEPSQIVLPADFKERSDIRGLRSKILDIADAVFRSDEAKVLSLAEKEGLISKKIAEWWATVPAPAPQKSPEKKEIAETPKTPEKKEMRRIIYALKKVSDEPDDEGNFFISRRVRSWDKKGRETEHDTKLFLPLPGELYRFARFDADLQKKILELCESVATSEAMQKAIPEVIDQRIVERIAEWWATQVAERGATDVEEISKWVIGYTFRENADGTLFLGREGRPVLVESQEQYQPDSATQEFFLVTEKPRFRNFPRAMEQRLKEDPDFRKIVEQKIFDIRAQFDHGSEAGPFLIMYETGGSSTIGRGEWMCDLSDGRKVSVPLKQQEFEEIEDDIKQRGRVSSHVWWRGVRWIVEAEIARWWQTQDQEKIDIDAEFVQDMLGGYLADLVTLNGKEIDQLLAEGKLAEIVIAKDKGLLGQMRVLNAGDTFFGAKKIPPAIFDKLARNEIKEALLARTRDPQITQAIETYFVE